MTHARFFLPPSEWQGEDVVLSGEEARHCAQVTRHREGDSISVFDGYGRSAAGTITSLGKDTVKIHVTQVVNHPVPAHPVTLVQGIVKGDTMDWIIEKAVELGVQKVVPWVSQRSIVRLSATDASRKRDKWQRVALEACKQCGQTWVPQVAAPCSLDAVLTQADAASLKLVTSLAVDAAPLRSFLPPGPGGAQPAPGGCVIAIGPEGDFTPNEYQAFRDAGWLPWSLGALTLRSETAAICALSILSYELHTD